MKYSIIIPAYNAEKYIKRCLDSIINQNYNNIEIIVVNDGSNDSTLEIVNNYKQSFIKVYSIENGGVSNARNYGLSKAKGDFVIFIDADDYLAEDFFQDIEEIKIQKKSIYVFNYKIFGNGKETSIQSSNNIIELSKEDTIKYCIKSNSNPYKNTRFNTVWGKIFDRDVILNIMFDQSISIGEDSIFFCESILASNKVFYVDKLMYYYYLNSLSLTHSYNEKMYENDVAWNKKIKNIVNQTKIKDKDVLINYSLLKGLLNNIILNVLLDNCLTNFEKKQKIKELTKKELFKNVNISLKMLGDFKLKDRITLILIKMRFFYTIILIYNINKHNRI